MQAFLRSGALLVALVALVSPWRAVHAQENRFELLSRDAVAQMPEVTIDTIRDKRTFTCYAIFNSSQRGAVGPAVGTAGQIVPRVIDTPQALRGTREDTADAARDRTADPQQWATIPWSAQAPGMPTGGWEQLAESMRRALVDPATARALSAPMRDALTNLDERLRRLESLLEQIAASRTFAIWPVSCDTAVNR
jgi:hypothetical protein